MESYFLAFICNDLKNANFYEVKDGSAYYKGDFIGEFETKIEDDAYNMYFKPVQPVRYITVNLGVMPQL